MWRPKYWYSGRTEELWRQIRDGWLQSGGMIVSLGVLVHAGIHWPNLCSWWTLLAMLTAWVFLSSPFETLVPECKHLACSSLWLVSICCLAWIQQKFLSKSLEIGDFWLFLLPVSVEVPPPLPEEHLPFPHPWEPWSRQGCWREEGCRWHHFLVWLQRGQCTICLERQEWWRRWLGCWCRHSLWAAELNVMEVHSSMMRHSSTGKIQCHWSWRGFLR